jgi:hypothetical protein
MADTSPYVSETLLSYGLPRLVTEVGLNPKPRGQLQKILFFLEFLTYEDGTDMLSRNVGKVLPFDAE